MTVRSRRRYISLSTGIVEDGVVESIPLIGIGLYNGPDRRRTDESKDGPTVAFNPEGPVLVPRENGPLSGAVGVAIHVKILAHVVGVQVDGAHGQVVDELERR